jgi:hypothetical protein
VLSRLPFRTLAEPNWLIITVLQAARVANYTRSVTKVLLNEDRPRKDGPRQLYE